MTAAALRVHVERQAGAGHRPPLVTYSPKVFLPLTQLCRNVCHYCTFAQTPRQQGAAFLTVEQVLEVARKGADAGCLEALFTIGDRPEARYAAARDELAAMNFSSTVDYLEAVCREVARQTGLLPHINAGALTREEMARLRSVSVSQGLMLESLSERLCEKGGPHHGSPDKLPSVRLRRMEDAGELAIPFTTGLLVGIGETRRERLETLVAIRDSHARHGHIQEVIVQNFRAKPGTRMANAPEPSREELLWTVSAARMILGEHMPIQVPPNLNPCDQADLLQAGVTDWGGVSPVTRDFVNPEAAWPARDALREVTEAAGYSLVERLAIQPRYLADPDKWVASEMMPFVLQVCDAEGLGRAVSGWSAGRAVSFPAIRRDGGAVRPVLRDIVARARNAERLAAQDVATLFEARGAEFDHVCENADALRREMVGDDVTWVVTRNINYTNMCTHRCTFCAFSKGRGRESLRGPAYDLSLDEVARRAGEAWARGATEVCMQGGIHPSYDGNTYLSLLETVKSAVPGMHVHAFSPLEVAHGAHSLGLDPQTFLGRLRDAGLGSLPGTAAEVLDEQVRPALCPDKLTTGEWLDVVEAAHRVGLKTTSTIMFGHLDRPIHWARHLLALRDLQQRTGGITEFVPLPFVHDEAPLYRAGKARRGPSAREAILMHAVARLALHPVIPNIQVSWVKLGPEGAAAALRAGANDLGGTLMNESISNAAGAQHGQEFDPARMEGLIAAIGRTSRQRTTLYEDVTRERRDAARQAVPLAPLVLTAPARKQSRAAHTMEETV